MNYSREQLKKKLTIDDKTLMRFEEIRQNSIEESKKSVNMNHKIKVLGISGSARDQLDTAAESSNSEFLLKSALEYLNKKNVDTELVALRKYDIRYCKACYSTTNTQCHCPCSCYPKGTKLTDDMSNILYDKVLTADIIIFATPVNNFKMSSKLSLFIDRCISLDGSLQPADPKNPKNRELNVKHSKFVELMADQKIPGSGYLRRFRGKVAGIIVTGHEEGASMVISSLFMTLNHFGMVFPPWNNIYAMSSVLNGTYADKPQVNNKTYIKEAQGLAENTLTMAKILKNANRNVWQYDFSSN